MSRSAFNLEKEYGYFLERLKYHLEDESLAHFGVKGMKWGVRKEGQGHTPIVGLGPDSVSVKTSKGDTLTLTKDPPPPIAKFLARVKPKYAEQANNYATLSINDSTGKKVGTAQVAKISDDEINLGWLTIKKSERGQGYATATMKAAIEFGEQSGAKELTLEVPRISPDAKHIYSKLGFVDHGPLEGEGPDSYDPWGGLDKMVYTINKPKVKHASDLRADGEAYLAHYGVKGMQWGVRREGRSKAGTVGLVAATVAGGPFGYLGYRAGENIADHLAARSKDVKSRGASQVDKMKKSGVMEQKVPKKEKTPKVSRAQNRELNAKAQNDFNEAKATKIYDEAKANPKTTIVQTRKAWETNPTLMMGHEFTKFLNNEGVFDITMTEVYARKNPDPAANGAYLINDKPIGRYQQQNFRKK